MSFPSLASAAMTYDGPNQLNLRASDEVLFEENLKPYLLLQHSFLFVLQPKSRIEKSLITNA